MTRFDDIRERTAQTKHSQVYEHQAQIDREYLMDKIDLMQQALDLALPEMDYDKRFAAVHESIVQTLKYDMDSKMDSTELCNVLTARALQALEAFMEAPYE